MAMKKLSDDEKKIILKQYLGPNYHSVGQHFQVFSKMIDGLGHVNDAIGFAELIPALNSYLSGPVVSRILSGGSFVGILLFPVQQLINLLNANETGYRMYSYRAISYSITAWAFNKPIPSQSPRVISNLRSGSGPVAHSHNMMARYHKVWWETANSVVNQLNKTCIEKNIQKPHLKAIFRALGEGRPEVLSRLILTGFEDEFGHTTKHIWRSTYSTVYPN